MKSNEDTLRKCLFFSANRLANVLRRIVNDVYEETGIATPHIYLLILVNQYPGITVSELSEKLDIAPSTCTRFVNSLEKQGILHKEQDWKTVHITLTEYGKEKAEGIDASIARISTLCKGSIGEAVYKKLSADMWEAANKFDNV